MFTADEITYELFEINPAAFYKERFLYPQMNPAEETAAMKATIGYQKTEFLLENIRTLGLDQRPVKILDLACGSGVYGARIKYYFPQSKVYGIDLSPDCSARAMRQGYEQVIAHDVLAGLPYDDNDFDFVFTMDFFGHVEFARKDHLIQEIRRITKTGQFGFHGIETGDIDYFNCNPKNPSDYVRKYVYFEGHIGVENLDALVDRFSRFFKINSAFPWPINPFLYMENIISCHNWGEEFSRLYAQFDSYASRVCTDMALGHCNKYFLQIFKDCFGPVLTKKVLKTYNLPHIEQLVSGQGFSFLLLQKPAT
jgi:SAM-dependent methyltransferase